MRTRSIKRYTTALIAGLFCLTPGLSPANAQWGSIDIAAQSYSAVDVVRNVATMILPDGTPAVGYADQGLFPTVAFIESDVVRTISNQSAPFLGPTRFEADPFGIISYTKSSSTTGPLYGTDHGQRTDLFQEADPVIDNSQIAWPTTDLALDSRGVPTLVAFTKFTPGYAISSFDIPSASWDLRTISSSLASGPAADTVAIYTPDDRLVLSSHDYQGKYELLIEQQDTTFYSINVPTTTNIENRYLNSSIAASDNQVAFLFGDQVDPGITVGIFEDGIITYESIPSPQDNIAPARGTITPGSLAYAPDGTLSLVYVEDSTGQIVFAQRNAPDDWELESVEANGILASLAFNDDGTPYVGVASESGISLHSPDLFVVLGDMDGGGVLTNADIPPFVQALTDPDGYAAAYPDVNPDRQADFDGDGLLTNADIPGFVNALTGPANAELLALVPEPNSLAVLLLGSLCLASRRRR